MNAVSQTCPKTMTACSMRPDCDQCVAKQQYTSQLSDDALRLSHIRNAYYEWRGGSITLAQMHSVLGQMVKGK